jgi:uncharacterized protein YqhQ
MTMKKSSAQFTSIGGQAVIEGVMMRSPHFIAVAVRKPNQRIVIRNRPYVSFGQKYPILKEPVLRGVVTLLESMIQGVDALGYSANIASDTESSGEQIPPLALAGSIATAILLGMGIFVALPHLITVLITSSDRVQVTAQSPIFHLMDGGFKMIILLTYVYLIGLMKDIHRVFQYHGAEHKSIYTFEAGEDLTVANARKYTTLHPRCGTSFLLFLVLISILVFSFVFPIFHLTQLTPYPVANHLLMVVIKVILMLPVAGFAYEFIRACAFRMNNPIFKMLIWPGMLLQKLTTREPDDGQLEVALASLRQVLLLEKINPNDKKSSSGEFELTEIANLSELTVAPAGVTEFPEL